MTTRFDHYQNALRLLREAAQALDHAAVPSDGVARLMAELETAQCGDCSRPLLVHDDKGEYEHIHLAGPCGCGWGKEVA